MRYIITAILFFGGALALAGAFHVGGHRIDRSDWSVIRSQDNAIKAEIRRRVSPEVLHFQITEALLDGDFDRAVSLEHAAEFAGVKLNADTKFAIEDARAMRAQNDSNPNAGATYLAGDALSASALQAAVMSDLVALGDGRDIYDEGAKLVSGLDYDAFSLGLSVVSLAADSEAEIYGEVRQPAQIGSSILKTGGQYGLLTDRFSRDLANAIADGIDFPRLERALSSAEMTDPLGARALVGGPIALLREDRLLQVSRLVGALAPKAGVGETVRLMRYVETPDDLTALNGLAALLNRQTEPVVTLTNMTSVAAFERKTTIPLFISEHFGWLLTWTLAVIGALVTPAFIRVGRS